MYVKAMLLALLGLVLAMAPALADHSDSVDVTTAGTLEDTLVDGFEADGDAGRELLGRKKKRHYYRHCKWHGCPHSHDKCHPYKCNHHTGKCYKDPVKCEDNGCVKKTCNPKTGQCDKTAGDCGGTKCHPKECNLHTGVCESGMKVVCDSDPCKREKCDESNGECKADPVKCTGTLCAPSKCKNGVCVTKPKKCPKVRKFWWWGRCKISKCDERTGKCKIFKKPGCGKKHRKRKFKKFRKFFKKKNRHY